MSTPTPHPNTPQIRLERRIEWMDTDASGLWHNTALWRLVEGAQTELHRRLGILDHTFGATPRRRISAEFLAPAHFDQMVSVDLWLVALGRTSATYGARVTSGDTVLATAELVEVHVPQGTTGSAPWPPAVRDALTAPASDSSG